MLRANGTVVSLISMKKSETLHLTLACQSVNLHRSQCLNDIQARCSNRRQKTTDESHQQRKP